MESEGSASGSSTPVAADNDYQYFRSHGSLVRVKASHNSTLNVKYVFWSDLRICFPGIVRVQQGDVAVTFMRNDDEHRLKPFRIQHIPGEILDVIYNTPMPTEQLPTHLRQPNGISCESRDHPSSISGHSVEGKARHHTASTVATTTQPRTHPSKPSAVNLGSTSLSQLEDSLVASIVALTTKEVLAEQNLGTAAPRPTLSLASAKQLLKHRHHDQQHDQSLTETPLSLKATTSRSSSLGFSNESEYDVVEEHSADQDSVEENGIVASTGNANLGGGKDGASTKEGILVNTSRQDTAAASNNVFATLEEDIASCDNTSAQSNATFNIGADFLDKGLPREKPELPAVFALMPPSDADDETKAEFLELKQEVVACFHLFYSYLKLTTDYQILQAERRCLALGRHLQDLHERIPEGHALRHQFDLVRRDTIQTRALFRTMRSEFLQPKADQITGTHFGVFEHLEQKMFVILPESSSLEDGFRLHFLCECCQLTRIKPEEGDKKDMSTLPHHLHFSKHEGYKLRYTEEFVARYGYHMWVLLQMLLNGYKDQGVTIPPLAKGSTLHREIETAIQYIENEPDSGDREGSWDFSRVSEFYVPVSVSKEGSVGSLFRIVTKEGYAKWICFEHYRERFPENDYKILKGTLKTFFYNEALGAVLVSLSSRKEATDFYEAIIKASNVQELGLELNWDANEQDIKALQAVLPRTTAVSIKIFVPFEHHVVSKATAATFKDQTRGIDIHNPDYALGHYKTNLIKQVVDSRRIQAFHLDILDDPDHTDYEESLNLTLRNTSTFENWDPDRMNPALCDMVRTAGPNAMTKLSFNSPTLERGFFFMNNAIKGDVGLVMLKAMVNYHEQVSIRSGKDEARKSMRIQHWSSNTLKFANKLEGLWLDVRTPQETRVLQQLIELNPYLKKLRVTTETNTFYKIYEAVQKAVVVWKHKVPMKLVLRDEQDTSLTWSELVVPPERKQEQVISLEYSAGATNISTVLMFFGYTITQLKCLEFTNLDVKTLEACTRSRGSNIMSLEVNILGLNKKGLDDLAKVIQRSHETMFQLSSHFSIHVCVMEGVRPDWARITEFVVSMGPKVDELVLYSPNIGGSGFEAFLETVTPKVLPYLEVLVVNGSVGMLVRSLGGGSLGGGAMNGGASLGSMLGNFSMDSITSLSAAMSAASSVAQNSKKIALGPGSAASLNGTTNSSSGQTTSSQLSSKFLPWLESFVSELRLQKLGLNLVLLETEEWRSVLSKINFSELQILDLKGSKMTMAMFYELPLHFPTYDRFSTTVSPVASYEMASKRSLWARSSAPNNLSATVANGAALAKQYHGDSGDSKQGPNDTQRPAPSGLSVAGAGTIPENTALLERRRRRTVQLKEWRDSQLTEHVKQEVVPKEEQERSSSQENQLLNQDSHQQTPDKKQTCPVYRVRLPSTSDFKLERYQKVMIQNEIRALLIGCEVD